MSDSHAYFSPAVRADVVRFKLLLLCLSTSCHGLHELFAYRKGITVLTDEKVPLAINGLLRYHRGDVAKAKRFVGHVIAETKRENAAAIKKQWAGYRDKEQNAWLFKIYDHLKELQNNGQKFSAENP